MADAIAPGDFPRFAVASRHLLDTAEAHGLGTASILDGTVLTIAQLANPDAVVQARQELAIVRNLRIVSRIGRRYPPSLLNRGARA